MRWYLLRSTKTTNAAAAESRNHLTELKAKSAGGLLKVIPLIVSPEQAESNTSFM